ncbi:MAG: putative transposase [Thermodesulfobacterium sp.]|jgi:transposase-like protein|nr:putative transposase [Thermodesulfobacterium sp.]
MKLPYSPEQIEEIKEELYNQAKELKTKELPQNLFAMFIDAYHTQIKDTEANRIRKAVIYNIIGIDMEGRKIYFLITFILVQRRRRTGFRYLTI